MRSAKQIEREAARKRGALLRQLFDKIDADAKPWARTLLAWGLFVDWALWRITKPFAWLRAWADSRKLRR